MVVGIISDTHGLLRPEAVKALQGVRYIVHGGDIGDETILHTLAAIAPVTVVRGNTDHDAWARRVPRTAVLDVAGVRIYAVHDIDTLDIDPPTAGVDVVVFGHSHRPGIESRNGVMYLNPGSAGPRRFNLPVSVARLTIENGAATAEIIEVLPAQ
ncbi:MAG TPA: metallophosphoesterase family protein [Candidatus Krumholzibacteria bacterium]|nr:metallophosphoesterase family protein [Candidatus Krumholzibacteria bacterium]